MLPAFFDFYQHSRVMSLLYAIYRMLPEKVRVESVVLIRIETRRQKFQNAYEYISKIKYSQIIFKTFATRTCQEKQYETNEVRLKGFKI